MLAAHQAGIGKVYAKGDATQAALAERFGVSVTVIQRALKLAKATADTTTGA